MNNNQKEERIKFPGRRVGEKVNLFFRRHPLSFFGFGVIGFVMTILPLAVFIILVNNGFLILEGSLEPKIAVGLISVYLLFILGLMIVAWMNFYLDVYIVTDKRLVDIHQEGLFNRNLSAVDLVDVEDVKADVKGFLATYFNFGTVNVQTAGELQNIQFTDVPEPYKLARKVMDYHEQAVREQRKEAIKKVTREEKSIKKEVEQPKTETISQGTKMDLGEVDIDKPPQSTKLEEIGDSISEKNKGIKDKEKEKGSEEAEEDSDSRVSNKELKKGGEIDL